MRFTSAKARVAATLAGAGLFAAGPAMLSSSAFGQAVNLGCIPTTVGGGIGNDTGNATPTGGTAGCAANATGVATGGNNSAAATVNGNNGNAFCFAFVGPAICPVINHDGRASAEVTAGDKASGSGSAQANGGGSAGSKHKKGKKKS